MGELLKVMAIGRDLPGPLLGFRSGDRSHRLVPSRSPDGVSGL
jgi:hypothetical protein